MKRALPLAMCTTLLAGCLSNYAVTLNEKVMYTPPPLFSDFRLADVALDTCVRQHIADQNVHAPAELKRLNCSNAGIRNLAGLELFDHIEQLKLDENHITNIDPLAKLPRLKALSLARNNLASVAGLKALSELESLKLAGNDKLTCADIKGWKDVSITAPSHCPSP